MSSRLTPPAAALALGGIAAGTFLWRTLAWPPAASPDAWAYVSWGEALLRGERPAFDLTSTTPKPLATVLGALASPLPPERAMGVVVALALGVLVAALFVAAARCASAAAGVLAIVVFVAVGRLSDVISFQLIDAVMAALIAIAFALRRRGRLVALVLAELRDSFSTHGRVGALVLCFQRRQSSSGPSFSSSRRIAAFRLRTATCCRRSSLSRSASASSSRGSCRECSPPGLPPRSRLRVSSS
jgi:hypothetical protein